MKPGLWFLFFFSPPTVYFTLNSTQTLNWLNFDWPPTWIGFSVNFTSTWDFKSLQLWEDITFVCMCMSIFVCAYNPHPTNILLKYLFSTNILVWGVLSTVLKAEREESPLIISYNSTLQYLEWPLGRNHSITILKSPILWKIYQSINHCILIFFIIFFWGQRWAKHVHLLWTQLKL